MRRRFQIVIANQPRADQPEQPLGIWSRFKLVFVGLGLVVIAVAILVLALVLGSILAAALWVCLVLIVAAVILKLTWLRLRGGGLQS